MLLAELRWSSISPLTKQYKKYRSSRLHPLRASKHHIIFMEYPHILASFVWILTHDSPLDVCHLYAFISCYRPALRVKGKEEQKLSRILLKLECALGFPCETKVFKKLRSLISLNFKYALIQCQQFDIIVVYKREISYNVT